MYKNAKLIRAVLDYADKGENLLVFLDTESESRPWRPTDVDKLFNPFDDRDFFLCLPQHNESGQCLHWLNGGEIQEKGFYFPDAFEVLEIPTAKWTPNSVWMDSSHELRIKPKKEKRWVCISSDGYAVPRLIENEQALINTKQLIPDAQFIEIEVEV